MLLASHNMGEVERMCDDVIMLRAGLVVDQGSPQALLARYGREDMEQVFLDVARGRESRARRRARGAAPAPTRRDAVERARARASTQHRGGARVGAARRARWCAGTPTCCSSRGRGCVSMAYYPTVTMVLWAFVTIYLAPTNNFLNDAPGLFIGAVLLWDVLFRGQLGVSLTFIEELYSRNLGNLFVSPLTLPEFVAGPAGDEHPAHADRRRRRLPVRVAAVPLLDLLARLSADRVLRQPAGVRLGDRPRGLRR